MQFLQRNWFCRNADEVPQRETEPNHIVPRIVLVASFFQMPMSRKPSE